MNVLIVGCGKLGTCLAETLFHHGHDVSIISMFADEFKQLSDDFSGLTVVGMPLDMSILRDAGVEGCDAVAVVTNDDNLNITVSQIVREFFHVDNVIARISNPTRDNVFKQFGLSTMCQTTLSCDAIFTEITQSNTEQQFTFGYSTMGVMLRDVDPILIGRTLDMIPTKAEEIVIGVMREDKCVELNGKNQVILNPRDKIMYLKKVN